MQIPYKMFGILIFVLCILSSAFTVDQRQYAVVFQFGEAIRTIDQPGLMFKIPFIQNVEMFDKRLIHVDAEAKELTASDGKRVIVDAFAKFKITDPIMFYKTVHNYNGVKVRLNKILESSMRQKIGRLALTHLLSGERENVMHQIRDYVNTEAKSFGVDVVDVRILRADLPKENSAGIYRRMQTEREKEAKQIRAEGQEEAARIISKADKESQIIIAEAYKEAQMIKGAGDAAAAKIYNEAFSKDPEFYRFYRHISAYKNAMKSDDTVFILSPESPFFQYLQLNK
jgi:membrane protease subunit HflC